ncbi:hypothetical protein MPTK1_1g12410 [Marchantia polymorpha subsp. ruderalis]|uniref:Uncharacterized protein n=2 Tax=Marchantia polymorpha TaxID=3197 RepID=A0AAF6APD2_MARPO|nr:hypothetical protein MARPO_0019s0011 [Marchantia polymorpha]BBM98302.1 hypothetical protein Mp_1g12410 [Marchantia polymorpha subsp. ruderalis]|eukprot:PTQ44569.1 hypothetical protein MARPO_0019s0011 [Marchantia polymorpha]
MTRPAHLPRKSTAIREKEQAADLEDKDGLLFGVWLWHGREWGGVEWNGMEGNSCSVLCDCESLVSLSPACNCWAVQFLPFLSCLRLLLLCSGVSEAKIGSV